MSREKQIEDMANAMCNLGESNCKECAKHWEFVTVPQCDLVKRAEHLYSAGYRKQSDGEWISVDERLPENLESVLVLATSRYEDDGYDVLIAYHDRGEWAEQCVHSHECTEFYIYADVKFWMPLPKPPKGE
jgi:hypothetical protein